MKKETKTISVVSPCFNEEDNIIELYKRLLEVAKQCPKYNFEYIFIDNASTDKTVDLLRDLALKSPSVKIIINTRNFGHIRSPYWGVIQSRGDATIYLASDLQDPPELIPKFIELWEAGAKVVMAIKPVSETGFFLHRIRKLYYKFLDKISDVPIIKDATGFGLYDKVVLDHVRTINDPYPYFRGIIAELGYQVSTIPFTQARRLRGVSKNNFYSLYDTAMLGIVSHSLVPIRVASFLGFFIGFLSILIAFAFFILKLIYWENFPLGIAPIIIGMFLIFGIILIFIGVIGEYVGSVHTYLQKRPIVVEKERINFD
jgi:glycosyltransferase involved in cell wall biosynthesis